MPYYTPPQIFGLGIPGLDFLRMRQAEDARRGWLKSSLRTAFLQSALRQYEGTGRQPLVYGGTQGYMPSAGFGGPPSTGDSLTDWLIQRWEQEYEEAKAANEARYAQLLGGWGALRDTVVNQLGQLSQQGLQDIRQQFENLRAKLTQQAVDRGLRSSGVYSGIQSRIQRDQAAAENDWRDRILRERLNALTQLEGQRLGVIERRQDLYPDHQTMIQLIQAGSQRKFADALLQIALSRYANAGISPFGQTGQPQVNRPIYWSQAHLFNPLFRNQAMRALYPQLFEQPDVGLDAIREAIKALKEYLEKIAERKKK